MHNAQFEDEILNKTETALIVDKKVIYEKKIIVLFTLFL